MPRVSVIIPVYNGENYIRESIDSVLQQSYRDFELLVVDDGSTDHTWSVIAEYMEAHPTLIRGIHKANGGTATALNQGIRAAKGKYIAWLSHDDCFVPHKLEAQLRLVDNNPQLAGVYSDFTLIDAAGKTVGRAYSACYPPAEAIRHLLQLLFINGSTLLVERRCLQEAGLFDESLRYAHDALMWVELLYHYQLGYLPEALTAYRIHASQTTLAQLRAVRRDTAKWCSKMLQKFSVEQIFPELATPPVNPAEVAAAYIYLGDVLVTKRAFALSLTQYRKAWRAWPNPRNRAPLQIAAMMIRFCLVGAKRIIDRNATPDHLRIPEDSANNPLIWQLNRTAEPIRQVQFRLEA